MFIASHRHEFSVAAMCRLLGVSRSGFYAWCGRAPSPRAAADQALTTTISMIHAASRGTYGAPRVHAELADEHGICVGRKRVARLMRAAGLRGVCRRRRHHLTRRDRHARPAPDRVNRRFLAPAPDRLWVSDLTYARTGTGWLYLAVVIDVFSRRVVGWSMADHLRTELAVDALRMATATRRPTLGTIFHSDQGCQYTALAFGQRIRDAGLLASMGSVGDCFDNALAESFFATLECELLDRVSLPTRTHAEREIFTYIEGFYNPRRRHSALGYVSPAEHERRWHTAQVAPAAA